MFDNPRAWTTVCDCIDIASRAIRSIVDPSYNLGLAMGQNIPPHASRRDVGYPSYPQNQMYNGNVYPTQNQYPSYPPPPQYGVYPAPYIPGKTDPNYGFNPNPAPYSQAPQYQTNNSGFKYFNPPQYQSPFANTQNVTYSFGPGAHMIDPPPQNGGRYGY